MNINTALNLVRDEEGRLKISNVSCDARIAKMRAKFSGTLGSRAFLHLLKNSDINVVKEYKLKIDQKLFPLLSPSVINIQFK